MVGVKPLTCESVNKVHKINKVRSQHVKLKSLPRCQLALLKSSGPLRSSLLKS